MDKLYIIKIGGNIIDHEEKLLGFLLDFSRLKGHKILVHGGGKLATRMAEQLQIPQQLIDGRRITDAETLKIVTMVYAGYINKNIVARLQSHGCNATGLCGADGNAILARKRVHPVTDYGFVGDVVAVNEPFLRSLLGNGLTPVVAPVTHNGEGQLLNTNADTIAQELAKSLSAGSDTRLVYCFEKNGVLEDVNNDDSVISRINPAVYQALKAEEKIFAGMIPKLDNAFAALDAGVSEVIIGKAENLAALVEGRAGTSIVNEQ